MVILTGNCWNRSRRIRITSILSFFPGLKASRPLYRLYWLNIAYNAPDDQELVCWHVHFCTRWRRREWFRRRAGWTGKQRNDHSGRDLRASKRQLPPGHQLLKRNTGKSGKDDWQNLWRLQVLQAPHVSQERKKGLPEFGQVQNVHGKEDPQGSQTAGFPAVLWVKLPCGNISGLTSRH